MWIKRSSNATLRKDYAQMSRYWCYAYATWGAPFFLSCTHCICVSSSPYFTLLWLHVTGIWTPPPFDGKIRASKIHRFNLTQYFKPLQAPCLAKISAENWFIFRSILIIFPSNGGINTRSRHAIIFFDLQYNLESPNISKKVSAAVTTKYWSIFNLYTYISLFIILIKLKGFPTQNIVKTIFICL